MKIKLICLLAIQTSIVLSILIKDIGVEKSSITRPEVPSVKATDVSTQYYYNHLQRFSLIGVNTRLNLSLFGCNTAY